MENEPEKEHHDHSKPLQKKPKPAQSVTIPSDDRLWRVKEAAAYLGYHPGSLYRIVERERAFPSADPIPCERLSNRALRFDPVFLKDWTKRRKEVA